jgi:flavin-dependent dehydrogenase
MKIETCDVAVIGGGPAGAVAAAILAQKGWDVRVYERQHFPRFSIGESLLPQSMGLLEEAGLLEDVMAGNFQFKDGAAFAYGDRYTDIYFPEKFSPGWGTTFQVRRDKFDKILIDGAAKKGAKVEFGTAVTAFSSDASGARMTIKRESGEEAEIRSRFTLDGSGFGRTLPRLLDLEAPSSMSRRRSTFRHVVDNIDDPSFDRNKILVSVNPNNPQIWYWLIPLADGLSSTGVVGPDEAIAAYGDNLEERLDRLISEAEMMSRVLKNATRYREANEIIGFSANVKTLVGPSFALLGNAAEFLDPVFSSGVTIALKSATMASCLVDRQLRGETVDWEGEFSEPLKVGVETFRAHVQAWYDGGLQKIIFNRPMEDTKVTSYLTSVLAGYAWDKQNPIVREPVRFLKVVEKLCDPLA